MSGCHNPRMCRYRWSTTGRERAGLHAGAGRSALHSDTAGTADKLLVMAGDRALDINVDLRRSFKKFLKNLKKENVSRDHNKTGNRATLNPGSK